MSREEFAKLLGYKSYEALIDASEEIFVDGDVSWFITPVDVSGSTDSATVKFATWDDAELSQERVDYYDEYWQAEDALTVAHAYQHEDSRNAVLEVLEKLHEQLERPHREGHCEHDGYCQLVPIFINFVESPAGEKTLQLLGDWWSSQTPGEMFAEIFSEEFDTDEWIAEEEIPAWLEEVKAAGLEHMVKPEYMIIRDVLTERNFVAKIINSEQLREDAQFIRVELEGEAGLLRFPVVQYADGSYFTPRDWQAAENITAEDIENTDWMDEDFRPAVIIDGLPRQF